MGTDRFKFSAYANYSDTNRLKSLTREQVFTSRIIPQALDPKKIVLRESCDSTINPNSTPIILGLDVTGSMGFVAEEIAKESLPDLMGRIYEEQVVTDPHLMFMGIGDVYCDDAPLQVSQFEAGAVVLIEQLRTLWLEGGGGGNRTESYDIPWYFAANKTAIDSFTKRGEKGYLFTIGDEMPPAVHGLSKEDIKKTFGPGQHVDAGSTVELLATVQEKYKVFHIIAEQGNYARSNLSQVRAGWTELFGPNVIFMRDHKYLPDIIVATLKMANGEDPRTVINASPLLVGELEHAFQNALQG